MSILNIQVDPKSRQFLLDNKETIVIVSPQNGIHNYSIACVSFSPFGDNSTVLFQDDWIEYASSQDIQLNEVITMSIMQQVSKGNLYIFNGVNITNNGPAYSSQVYGLSNQGINNNNLTCGLGQSIVVNNNDARKYPLNVYSTPNKQTTYFQPTTKIWIFIASGIDTSMVIATQMLTPINSTRTKNRRTSNVLTVGNYLEIDLTETSTVIFDPAINAFKV